MIDEMLVIVNDDTELSKRFLTVAYLRFLLVANANQTIIFLNDLFEIVVLKNRFLN